MKQRFGWEVDPNLPPGYLKKEEGLDKNVHFLTQVPAPSPAPPLPPVYNISQDNKRIKGYAALLDHLLDCGFDFQVPEMNWLHS